jgi:mannitol/fructose-specific phosphotransferase system IIA component (Ntr-type)
LTLLGAALTQWIRIHAIFGAFLVGAAIGDSTHLRESTRVTIDHFISFIFAPVFFASIGLKVNFATQFDLPLVLIVLGLALSCKLAGGMLGARWARMPPVEAGAVGAAMVSVGAMGIIIGLLALEEGIIDERLFVALVVMAMATSMISGPLIRRILQPIVPRRIGAILTAQFFMPDLKASSRRQVIREMTAAISQAAGLDGPELEAAVWQREEALSTGIGKGVALPHARIDQLNDPIVAMGISRAGIDFAAPDGEPAHVIFLILTPVRDPALQLEIVAQIARLFKSGRLLQGLLQARSFTDALALIHVASKMTDG